jgi:hypothetical protein
VHHCVLFGRNRLGLTLKNDRDHATAREVAIGREKRSLGNQPRKRAPSNAGTGGRK